MAVATMEETAAVTLSEAAASKLASVMAEKGLQPEAYALRVFVGGGGCSGLQYGMAFDGNPRATDIVFEQHGLRIVVDPRLLPYVSGASIDYIDSPVGGGFQIENPNAVSTCGCSQSSCSNEGCASEDAGCGGCS